MMKKLLAFLLILSVCVMPIFAQMESAPAFPGAEGHGRFVTGGRGGKVVHVTNLNDSGTGSFREAVSGSEKKIVVFDVGGVIALTKDLTIGANTTIEGQTAPAPGITLRYYTVQPSSNNVIRFIRFRRGQEKDVNDGADATWQRNKTGIIFDHCSFSWSIDEVASFYDNNNFTMQWCTIAESLTNPGHSKGAHGYGGIWGGKLASFHHNMIAHVSNRGPRFNGARYEWTGYTSNMDYDTYKWENAIQAENVDFRNCVMYNAQGTCYGGPGGGQINMVNNYFKAGPCGNGNQDRVTLVTVAASGNSEGHPDIFGMTSRYYIAGNTVHTTSGGIAKNRDWAGVAYDSGTLTQNGDHYSKDPGNFYSALVPSITSSGVRYVRIRMDEPAPTGYVTTHSAETAFDQVLKYVGASFVRDDVDSRYVDEAYTGTATYTGSVTGKKGLIDVVADVHGYTEANFGTGSRPAGYDTDKDGMPDEWELEWGLDPNNAADGKAYTMDTAGIYTNLEMYCNSLVEDIMMGGVEDALTSFDEYWPELRSVSSNTGGGDDLGEEVSLYLAASTNTGSNSSSSYQFKTNGYTVTVGNGSSKSYATGKEDGVKYSAFVDYTINVPAGIKVREVEFTGYDNYAEADSYVSDLGNQTFAATDYVFPKKDSSGNYIVKSNTVPVSATGALKFVISGKQVVLTILVKGNLVTTGIDEVAESENAGMEGLFNLYGQRVEGLHKGLLIKNGKKILVR